MPNFHVLIYLFILGEVRLGDHANRTYLSGGLLVFTLFPDPVQIQVQKYLVNLVGLGLLNFQGLCV